MAVDRSHPLMLSITTWTVKHSIKRIDDRFQSPVSQHMARPTRIMILGCTGAKEEGEEKKTKTNDNRRQIESNRIAKDMELNKKFQTQVVHSRQERRNGTRQAWRMGHCGDVVSPYNRWTNCTLARTRILVNINIDLWIAELVDTVVLLLLNSNSNPIHRLLYTPTPSSSYNVHAGNNVI